MFQGFEIKTQSEIEKLQSYCDFVLVDQLESRVHVPLQRDSKANPFQA